jgi:hypothetical protein
MTATTQTLKYSLKEFTDVSFSGFEYEISSEICNTINQLCAHVGATGLKNNMFSKQIEKVESCGFGSLKSAASITSNMVGGKKRRGNKAQEVSSDEWESLRTFQATKIEQKSGIEGEMVHVRLLLNKLTDKTFLDIRQQLMEKLNYINTNFAKDELILLGVMIYEVSSANKFYSKIFADIFAELYTVYEWIKVPFNSTMETILDKYTNISYVDSNVDYDGFCAMNKVNDHRKSVSAFIVNLAINGIISKQRVVGLLRELLSMVTQMIVEPNKANEVAELAENIAILYNRDILMSKDVNIDATEFLIDGKTVVSVVQQLAKYKTKDYVSLSNKALFKFMDLADIKMK